VSATVIVPEEAGMPHRLASDADGGDQQRSQKPTPILQRLHKFRDSVHSLIKPLVTSNVWYLTPLQLSGANPILLSEPNPLLCRLRESPSNT
jgi:hypothetical protein